MLITTVNTNSISNVTTYVTEQNPHDNYKYYHYHYYNLLTPIIDQRRLLVLVITFFTVSAQSQPQAMCARSHFRLSFTDKLVVVLENINILCNLQNILQSYIYINEH